MGPGFHRAYASRLAWRHRLLLALGLALLGFFHPLFALLSPFALLLPSRLWEGRALREIARVTLAYPTALAYGEERLWAEARKAPLKLPPFPHGLLFLYLLALLLALLLAAWRAEGGGAPWTLPGLERPAPHQGASGREGQGEGSRVPGGGVQGNGAPQEEEGSPAHGGGAKGNGTQEGEGISGSGTPQGETPPPSPGGGTLQGKGEGPPASPGARGERASPASEGRAGTGDAQKGPPVLPLTPQGEEAGLLAPGEGGGAALPAPWPGGRPPERVRRGVEVYLEKTLLAPEAQELIRRYFAAP
ncbi:MAG: hypothetical protein ABWJ90_02170 [Thermus sp.]|uniref:hypothetical protein n=1 Tax=Thermus sp. TaxID=275 RepID=UPI00351AF5F3